MSDAKSARERAHYPCPCRVAYLMYACGPIWCECRPNVATTDSTIQTPVVGTHPCLWPGHAAIDSLVEETRATGGDIIRECWEQVDIDKHPQVVVALQMAERKVRRGTYSAVESSEPGKEMR